MLVLLLLLISRLNNRSGLRISNSKVSSSGFRQFCRFQNVCVRYIIFMVSCIFSLFIIPKCKSSQMYLPQWYSFFLRRFCKWLIHTDFQAYIRKDCFTYIFHFLNSSVQFVCTIRLYNSNRFSNFFNHSISVLNLFFKLHETRF